MIRKSLLVLAVLAGISLSAAVKITSLPADQKNIEYWKIGNKYISAVISSQGGMLYQFSDKKSREEFVGKEGAFRDHFAPRNMAFATQLYQGKILESGPAKVVLELKAPQLEGLNQFNQITKTYTLEANASILNVSVRVYNQKESMTDAVYEYWCNSFLGPVQKNTDFLLPQADGILREKTGSNFFHTAPIAGWLGVIGKDSGVILLPDYKKFKLAYSWKCKGPFQRDTAEFRAVPEAIPAGSSTVYNYALAPFKGLDHLNGAGKSGCGKISVKGDQLTLQLAGFSPAKAQAVLLADNKECSRQNVDLTCGKINQYTFRLPGRCDKIQIEIRDTNGNLLFDLYQAVTKKARFLSRIQRNLPPRDNDVWQFDPKGDYKTAHFKWLDNKKKFDALILVEVTGSRDVIELQQRMNFNAEVPTLFPPSWTMSWRTKVAFTPGAPGDTGIDKLPPYLKKNYDVIVIGSSRVTTRKNLKNMRVSSWQVYPEAIRKTILEKVKKGTGLLLINPEHPDKEMEKILSSCVPAQRFAQTMTYSAAPYFPQAKITETTYGKGKIIVIRFAKADAFLAPLLKYRHRYFQLLSCKHRFQEYQFAVLAKIINDLRGAKNAITSFAAKDGKVKIKVTEPGIYNFEIFNSYSDFTGKFTKNLTAGEHTLPLPALQHGTNYIHVTLPGRDFAFAALEQENQAYIRAVRCRESFGKNTPVKARIRLSNAALKLPLEVTIHDNTGRLLFKTNKPEFEWNPVNAVVNRHIITARLFRKDQVISTHKRVFYLPEVFDLRKEYSHLLWVTADCYPEYTYQEHLKQLRQFGFNFLYGGSFGDASPLLLRFADVETGMNWYAGGPRGLHLSMPKINTMLTKYHKTQKKEDLIRVPCPNNPEYPKGFPPNSESYDAFCTRHLFQLGDEMSMTHFQSAIDFCFCKYCLTGFRNYLKANGWTLEKVNKLWKSNFKTWDDIMPMTFNETLFAASPAGFVLHRLYMDKVFADTLDGVRQVIRQKYPEAMAGPTGVKNEPHTYGGNWNFYNMRIFDCGSYYGGPRIQTHFNREKRFVMNYYGYDQPRGEETSRFWEGLFLGERNTNNWFGAIFLLPDLRLSQIRSYYSDLLWTLRSGVGDLFYHSAKMPGKAAILHSQRSVIANFLKSAKGSYADKEIAFARVFEDLGIPFKFIAHEELSADLLKNYPALVLSEATALSDADIKIIRNYIRKGGKVIADYETATQTELCNSRPQGALNDLFGIKASRQVYRKVNSHTLKGITIRNAVTGVKLTTGKAAGYAVTRRGKTPLAVTTKNTLYLNFETVYHVQREKAFRDLISNFLRLTPEARFSKGTVMHGLYINGKTRHYGLLAELKFPGSQNADKKQCQKHALKGQLELAQSGHAYDSLTGKYLGQGRRFNLTLVPGHGKVISLLPYPVKALKVTAPQSLKAGETALLDCEIVQGTTQKNEDHVFLMRVFRPDGKESLEYRRIRRAPGGKFRFTFPSALNDQGTWKFQFKDAATGVMSSCQITVK